MTSHYIDLRVVPDPETSAAQLLGALFNRLHLALVQQRLGSLGASFPGYSQNPRTLGNVLRLHAGETVLRDFMQSDWLKGLRDHVRMTEVAAVPVGALHRTVQRRQFKTNVGRLRRRRMRRKDESFEQASSAIPESVERRPNLPYLHLRSQSTGQSFCLFVVLGSPSPDPSSGTFNAYGFSNDATIPWF